eukprot:TRINITY_DN531_c0_g1_i1.p1 TRINITY_DN531_c0_g1~~TRINITY_DN531_c0_g1_i1.p1  ORF type:complete len:353 (+),score=29.71 TRINITY_DN531_c0_g1_i1:40-1059(+)
MAAQSKESRETLIQAALSALNSGTPYRTVERQYGIPRATLHYRRNTFRNMKPGRRRGLTNEEEQRIVCFLLRFAERGTPLTNHHLREAIKLFCETLPQERLQSLPFNFVNISDYFLWSFRQRHKDKLCFTRPLAQKNKRFRAVNAEALTHHFATLQRLVADYNLDGDRIFYLDEVGVTPDKDVTGVSSLRRTFPRRGSRDMVMNDYHYKNRITMMPVVSAAGDCGPLLVVVKGSRIPYRTVLKNGVAIQEAPTVSLPRNAVIATRCDTGGVDSVNFKAWAQRFVAYVHSLTINGRKVLLVYDAYRAHLSLEVLELFHQNNIIVTHYPHTHPEKRSHLMQ